MYKVFVNDKPIILTSSLLENENFEVQLFASVNIEELIYKLKNNTILGVILFCENLVNDWQIFLKNFTVVIAGGGLIKNKNDEFLFIFRNGKWDLPKGRQETNETIEYTAVREVEEECGLQEIKLGKKIIVTYHIYFEKKYKIKETHWFEMFVENDATLRPQIEEGITKIRFLNSLEIDKILPKTFANIALVIQTYQKDFLKG